ncbi:enoyl-CoA hydratase/isomerase family protein [Rhodococcus koreensis]|uniref:enoyl-CoA hydratase/isomerase family protein n=1 Tax=Rhodococcus koreensis TaxID=99653 RepID=UPI003672C362
MPENDVMGPSGLVTVSRASDARIAVLTLNRPQSLNALNTPLLDALDCALDVVARSDAFAGAILTGAGRAFSAGADLHELGVEPMARVRRMHALALRLRDFPKIIVASINGPALGGGLEVAMGCTFRMAAADASLGLPEIKMNLMPGFGGTQLLPRLVGESRALRILLSGDPVDAPTALRIGLVDAVSNGDPVGEAEVFLGKFLASESVPQQLIRAAVTRGAGLSLEDALEVERGLVERVSAGAAGQRGVSEFRGGRRH